MREDMRTARRAGTRAQRSARAIAGIAGAATALTGAWAFFTPRSFADFADFPPYNEHLIHDLGAFLLGLGATLLLALAFRDGLLVALGGSAVAGVFHFASHAMDQDLGGHAADVVLYGLLALLLVAAALVRYRAET